MKNDRSGRRWILFIIFLLALEALWLLVDFRIIDISAFRKKKENIFDREAGYVIKTNDQLKRRGANSLIWENADNKEVLFFQDSVLTLSQGSAKIYLNDDTELQLSENTLITIEEQNNSEKGEIRLRFSKGDLRARNPNSKAFIQGDDWIVNLEKGSEVALRKELDSYQFEILTGQASLETKDGTRKLEPSKILQLNTTQEIKTIAKIDSLVWTSQVNQRFYVSENSAGFILKWQGKVLEISLQKSGEKEIIKKVESHQNEIELNLPLGNYTARLRGADGVSEAIQIEIWTAPHLYLISPLPRDRAATGKNLKFLWSRNPTVKSYQLKFYKAGSEVRSISSAENSVEVSFSEDADLEWTVEGIDRDGFVIPTAFKNELFFREQPLQAPKLQAPLIREAVEEPTKVPSSFFRFQFLRLLLTNAYAAKSELFEVIFDWQNVYGADSYILEVAESAGFSKPILIKNLKSTSYLWRQAMRKKYFWRVAAANSKGRMGVFSEPMEIQMSDLQKIPVVLKPEIKETVEVRELVEPKVIPAELAPKVFSAPVEAPKPKCPASLSLAWAPNYKVSSVDGDENSKLLIRGGAPVGMHFRYQTKNFDELYYEINLKHSSQVWKASPKEKYPFQPDLRLSETWATIEQGHVGQNRRFGISIMQDFLPTRTSAEIISVKPITTIGFRVSWVTDPIAADNTSTYGASIHFSNEIQQLNFDFQKKYYWSERLNSFRGFIGGATHFGVQNQKVGTGINGNLFFLAGFDHL